MAKASRTLTVAAAIAIACAGCSSATDSATAGSSAVAAPRASANAADAGSSGGDFCSMYAAKVAQGLVDIRDATEGGVQVAEGIADDLAHQAPVSQSDLKAVAPAEPLSYLNALDEADAAGAEGDLSAIDAITSNLVLMNNWAKANCDAKYRPVFDEYTTIIG